MERANSETVGVFRVTCLVLVVTLIPLASLLSARDTQEFSDWSAPLNLGPPVNSAFADIAPFISKDGLSLYHVRNTAAAGGFGGSDIWVSRRASTNEPWGVPQNLGPTINTSANEGSPSLSLDGHRLYFARDGQGFGGNDLYAGRRHNNRDDFGWRPAVNLGSGINTPANELQPAHFEDDATGITLLYFTSDRPGGVGGEDIYVSMLLAEEVFAPALLVEELSTPFIDRQPAIRRDGLEMLLASDRPGTVGAFDLWASTRATTSDSWSNPVNLGLVVNTAASEVRPALSFDATELYFQSSARPGGVGSQDFYQSTRTKLKEPD